MTDFNAGAARATYDLDLGPLRRQVADAKRALAELDAARTRESMIALRRRQAAQRANSRYCHGRLRACRTKPRTSPRAS
jgi:hypothetical protein